MTEFNQPEANWRFHPLCNTYLLVLFETSLLKTSRDGANRRAVRWAFGTLANGQCEVLGVWPVGVASSNPWAEAQDELRHRGVERIGFVAGDSQIDAPSVFSDATYLPMIGQASRQEIAMLGPRDRTLAAADLAALLASGSLNAARALWVNQSSGPKGAMHAALHELWRCHLDRLAPFFSLSPRRRQVIRLADKKVRFLNNALARVAARCAGLNSQEALAEVVGSALERARQAEERGWPDLPPVSRTGFEPTLFHPPGEIADSSGRPSGIRS